MGALIRGHDWTGTSFGAPSAWPQSLRSALSICLNSSFPTSIYWGPELRLLYNDAWSGIAGERHPWALGRGANEVWADIWMVIAPQLAQVMETGEGLSTFDQMLPMMRGGQVRETYWNYSFTPIRGEDGRVAGVFNQGHETTDRVLGERKRAAEAERQKRLFEQAPGFITILNGPEHRFEFFNQAYARLFGDRQFIGRTAREVFPELVDHSIFSWLDQVYTTGEQFIAHQVEIDLRHQPDAPVERRILDFIYAPVIDENGQVTGIFCEGHDVTEAHVAQERLRESEARLRFLDSLARNTAGLAEADAVLEVTTRSLGEHLGLSVCAYADMEADQDGFTIRGDWTAPGSASIVGHYRLADFGELAVSRLRAGLPLVINDNLAEIAPEEAATFQRIGITATICMPLIKDERLTALMAIHDKAARSWSEEDLLLLREVTERSWAHIERARAEADVRESEARYRTLFEAIESGFCLMEAISNDQGEPVDFRIIEVNPSFAAQAGFGDAVGRTLREIVPDEGAAWIERYGKVAASGVAFRIEFGSPSSGHWWDIHAFRVGQARERRVAVLFTDITDRHRNELALRELNETLERRVDQALAERKILADLVEGTDAFVQVVGPDLRLLAINEAAASEFERVFAVRPRAGDHLADLGVSDAYHAGMISTLWERALAGEEFTHLAEAAGDNGTRHYEMKFNALRDSAGKQIGAFAFAYDITARVQEQQRLAAAEDQLRQSQKMEAMGQLTGGVAHDFNNLLTPIIGTLDALQRRGGSEREQRLIDGALQSAERAKTLVQRLLAFARRQPLQPVAVDVATLLRDMADLIASTIGPQIVVVVDVAEALPPAHADVNQVEMAVLNLSVNARDAMPSGGTLRISATAETLAAPNALGLPTGDYVRLSVADTGVGMDEATLARAFEPFFSTKGIGKGTGLGLSMVHGLAQQLGGALTINSHVGFGTNVELWLPRSQSNAERNGPSAHQAQADRGRGAALLVDDDDVVRATTADMLTELGYAVTDFADAPAALAALSAGLQVDVLVTDHLMPGMSGTDLVRAARAQRPDLPALIVSGYAELEGIDPGLARLTKPFRSAELAASLEGVSGSRGASGAA